MIVTATVMAPIAVSLDLEDELSIGEVRNRVLEQARWLAENNGLCFEIVELNIQCVSDGAKSGASTSQSTVEPSVTGF